MGERKIDRVLLKSYYSLFVPKNYELLSKMLSIFVLCHWSVRQCLFLNRSIGLFAMLATAGADD